MPKPPILNWKRTDLFSYTHYKLNVLLSKQQKILVFISQLVEDNNKETSNLLIAGPLWQESTGSSP